MKRSLWILAPLLLSTAAQAQYDQAQLVQRPGAADLNANLARLAGDPRDVAALIGAGEAALVLEDPRAAAGFFARADAIESGNGRIKAGLARVNLLMQNPGEALRLFDQAGRLGYPDTTILSDRALAKDMTGDQAGAQRDYQAALARTPDDDELVRRYAASLGISGQVDAAERIMKPLLYKSDRAAWRYRAFIYAMNNRQAEAKKIADETMPPQLAGAIVPYMQKMPYLTGAQKAAAVHYGHFPQQVGTAIAAITPTPPAPGGPVVAAPAAASPAPAQVATREDRRTRRARERAARLAAADSARTRTRPGRTPIPALPAAAAPAPALAAAAPAVQPRPVSPLPPQPGTPAFAEARPVVQPIPARPVPSAPSQALRAEPAVPPPPTASREVAGPPQPGFDALANAAPASTAPAPVTSQPQVASQLNAITLARASAPSEPTATPTPAQTAPVPAAPAQPAQAPPAPPAPDPAATRTLADIIRAIDVPESERMPTVAAVDLAEIEQIQAARRVEQKAAALAAADKAKKAAAAKAKAEADAKAKAEAEEKKRLAANPARSWLQIGIGANRGALPFTLSTMQKKYADLAPQQGWSASWGRTNRLLVGPFPSFARAKALEDKLKGEGADVFAWQSDAGEVVERVGGR